MGPSEQETPKTETKGDRSVGKGRGPRKRALDGVLDQSPRLPLNTWSQRQSSFFLSLQ